jgi:hypothetical protein
MNVEAMMLAILKDLKIENWSKEHETIKKITKSQAPVAHSCNSSYSGSKDQEDRSLKPAQANSSVRPYLKNTLHKNGLVEWLKV